MPENGRLKNIASGLCGAFASRNNDLDGYWSIGKLRLLAGQQGRSTVLLDVLASSMQPSHSGFAPVLARYRSLLAKLLEKSRIRLEEVTAVRITVDFAPEPWPRASYFAQQCGDQFVLTVTIDANGRIPGIARHAGYCRAHDPVLESRSTRWSGG